MSSPFSLPSGNSIVERLPPSECSIDIRSGSAKLVAQYHADKFMTEDFTLTVLEWYGNEYDGNYVVLLNKGEVNNRSIHNPIIDVEIFSRQTLIETVRSFLQYASREIDEVRNIVQTKSNEPWSSIEEYKEYLSDKQEEARWTRKRNHIHDKARENWEEEKRSREVVKELERTKHEFNIPRKPEIDEDIKDLKKKYVEGEITLFDFRQKIEKLMD
jgi:hypothetical protein